VLARIRYTIAARILLDISLTLANLPSIKIRFEPDERKGPNIAALANQHVDANRSCRRWNDRDRLEKFEIDQGSCMLGVRVSTRSRAKRTSQEQKSRKVAEKLASSRKMSALVLLTAWTVLMCLVQDAMATGQRYSQNPSQDLDNTLQSLPPLG